MYKSRRVLVTGGLGFIGSNLVIRLISENASVTVVDSAISGCGANPYNIASVRDSVKLIHCDLADARLFADEIAKADVIFNLAGEISHALSMSNPERDLQLNAIAQLRFLQTCRQVAPGVRIVFASTRQVYGRPDHLPVTEEHSIRPIDFNGVHKFAAAQYHLLLSRVGEISAVVLRLTNIYGPRMALHLPQQGFLATYLRRALCGQPLTVFGDGGQLRDPAYVDDVVEAFLLAGLHGPAGATYNVGGAQTLSVDAIAQTIERAASLPARVYRPFPDTLRNIDIGSHWSDCSLIGRDLRWKPCVAFEAGVRRTLAWYYEHGSHYIPAATAAFLSASATA